MFEILVDVLLGAYSCSILLLNFRPIFYVLVFDYWKMREKVTKKNIKKENEDNNAHSSHEKDCSYYLLVRIRERISMEVI